MKVADVVDTWPHTLDTFVRMGFAPMKVPFLRKTIGKRVTIRQAAEFRNVDLNVLLLNLQTAITHPSTHSEAIVDIDRLRYDESTVPDLEGDVRVVGLVPCPVRNVLIEKFDTYIQESFAAEGKKVAWWLAAEGSGAGDVKSFLVSIAKSNQFERFPEVFVAVGSELFLHEEYCRRIYTTSVFAPRPPHENARPELAALEDPNGKLHLQFAVLFSFYCDEDALGDLPMPSTWFDLTDPKYKGQIVIPTLSLPVIPDLLAALYYYLGDSLFVKFCQNVGFALHPAQSSSRKSKRKQPGVFITPTHFSRIMKGPGGHHVIPEDGCVAVPGYFTQTEGADERLPAFLRSKELLDLYYRFGTFVPNHAGIPVDVPLDPLITRPWHSLLEIIPDDLLAQLLTHFKLDVGQ